MMSEPLDDFFGSRKSRTTTLHTLLEDRRYEGTRLKYSYDLSSSWEHSVELIGRAEHASQTVTCVAGEGGPIKEDTTWEEEEEERWGPRNDGLWRWDVEKVNELLAKRLKLGGHEDEYNEAQISREKSNEDLMDSFYAR